MKTLISIALVLLTGCSTQQLMCAGTGACSTGSQQYTNLSTGTQIQNPRVVSSILLPTGNYLIVPNHSTGGISAVIQTSRTK